MHVLVNQSRRSELDLVRNLSKWTVLGFEVQGSHLCAKVALNLNQIEDLFNTTIYNPSLGQSPS